MARGFTRVGFLEGQIGDKGGASAPTTHPHRSRPYAAMPLPGSFTKKPTSVNGKGCLVDMPTMREILSEAKNDKPGCVSNFCAV